VLAGAPKLRDGRVLMFKHYNISVLPEVPGGQQEEAVEVLGRDPWRAGEVPKARDGNARHVHVQRCPDLLSKGASQDDVITIFDGPSTEFAARVINDVLHQQVRPYEVGVIAGAFPVAAVRVLYTGAARR
jgi:hypothetical protein